MKLKEYSEEQLKTFRFSRLGCLYMNIYRMMISGSNSTAKSGLEKIEKAIKEKSIEDRLELLRFMESRKIENTSSENYEEAEFHRKMIKQYYERVLLSHD